MKHGRPSQSVQILTSEGLSENAFDDLLAVHFEAPQGHDLNNAEQRLYDRSRDTHLTVAFKKRFRDNLSQKLRTLPRGIGAGPSGERYEHLRSVASTATGLDALLGLGGAKISLFRWLRPHKACTKWSIG